MYTGIEQRSSAEGESIASLFNLETILKSYGMKKPSLMMGYLLIYDDIHLNAMKTKKQKMEK
ncbi:hypothetical protein [Bacillus sp. T3]|uniref:hypothetical protein n=1 Tax=Bacillus sp. T3 TaxID=467262 RepID=UPI002981439B|nr:hypothetical protein [Bacillus sp. T3]